MRAIAPPDTPGTPPPPLTHSGARCSFFFSVSPHPLRDRVPMRGCVLFRGGDRVRPPPPPLRPIAPPLKEQGGNFLPLQSSAPLFHDAPDLQQGPGGGDRETTSLKQSPLPGSSPAETRRSRPSSTATRVAGDLAPSPSFGSLLERHDVLAKTVRRRPGFLGLGQLFNDPAEL